MKLLEYQAKKILAEVGLPVPKGKWVQSADEVAAACQSLGITSGVTKAQAFTGGRGKAGGIKLFKTVEEGVSQTKQMIGMTLVTKQTGAEGVKIHSVYIEDASAIAKEMYVAITLDRARANPVIMLCEEGGMDIEDIAESTPEKILKQYPDIDKGITPEVAAEGCKFLGIPESMLGLYTDVITKLYKVYFDTDCSLLEVNPLIITKDNKLSILDCKFTIDDNAVYRQKNTGGDPNAELTDSEIEAGKYGLNYIQLDGNIGCMVNGAGLAMATMDIIKIYGSEPANFLDVGGSASEEAVTKAFEIITLDSNVKGILVNIFGGIMECDKIARGIVNAIKKMGLKVPLVVRLSGTNSVEGRKIIDEAKLNLESADTLSEGAQKIVAAVKKAGNSAGGK